MIDEELLSKFNRIEDLPVSEEMLGAYMEGNLHGSEFREVNNFILSDADTISLMDTVEADLNFIRDLDLSYQQGFIGADVSEDVFSEMNLPEISILGIDSLIETSSTLNDDIILSSDCHNIIDDDHSFHSDSQHNNYHQHHDPKLDFTLTDNIE